MRKIMLVIDEFNELEFLESLLRRLGFDVLSLSKDVAVPSAILGFFPDLVMAQAKSRAVDGVVLSQKVRKLAPQARMVLLHPIGQPPRASDDLKQTVDAFLEMPVDPAKLIAMLAQLGSLDEKILQEKLNRFAAGKMSDDKRSRLQGKAGQSSQSNAGNMVGGGSGSRQNQSDVVHVTSRTGGAGQPSTVATGGLRESAKSTIVSGGRSGATDGLGGVTEGGVGDSSTKGLHHFQGQKQEGGAAYDPTGQQEAAKRGGMNYVPSQAGGPTHTGARSLGNSSTTEVTERTKRYEQFLAAHDEPVDKVIPQGEMKRQAKKYNLSLPTESDLDLKREFVRALFRK